MLEPLLVLLSNLNANSSENDMKPFGCFNPVEVYDEKTIYLSQVKEKRFTDLCRIVLKL